MSAEHLADDLGHGAAHVWWGTVGGPLEPGAVAVLSLAERERVYAMTAEAGLHYAGAHVAVRCILARYLGTDPALVRLGRLRCPECAGDDHGAPCVVWPPTHLSYSLSRSGPHWLLGVTGGRRRIGIDIEEVSPLDLDAVAPTVLSARELDGLRRQPDHDGRLAAFLRYWTRKEAVVKASGVGLMTDLCAVDVHDAPPGQPLVVRHAAVTGPGAWVVEDIAIGPGRHAAVAREAAAAGPLRLFGLTEMLETRSTPWPSATSSLSTI
ncbi:4'-phosphopantetheinyl transferase family protein [Streptomyces sp. NPDC001262]|uniref:4'-phosphopantetheinyl transferase family protein n=1 Tax=Streptomyces sp. NPDC001262 TaxID=3364552 RepID=UPI0036980B80